MTTATAIFGTIFLITLATYYVGILRNWWVP
jgi:hypothetical protein